MPALDLSARERELQRFSRRAGAVVKSAFATSRLIRYLRPRGKASPVTIGTIVIFAAGAVMILNVMPAKPQTALFFAGATAAAILVWLIVARWLWARWFFFRWKFTLLRYIGESGNRDFPYRMIECPRTNEATGFGTMYWADTRAQVPGELLVGVHDPSGSPRAIIPLRKRGRLAVRSTVQNRWIENALPKLPSTLEALAAEFHARCDEFLEIGGLIEQDRALNFATSPPEESAALDLEEVWRDAVISAELKQRLIDLARHFSDGSPAASSGLLLHGAPGTGKTLIARKLADTMRCEFIPLGLAALKGSSIGESAQKVKQVWAKARAARRAVLFVDECEGVFGRRGSARADAFIEEMVQTFLAEWDGFAQQKNVWVVGATNRREMLDEAILSRFGEEIEIPMPGAAERTQILRSELTKKGVSGELPPNTAAVTQGFTGRDLADLAGRIARRVGGSETAFDASLLEKLATEKRKQGSTNTTDDATWDRLILPDKTLKVLKQTVELLKHAETFTSRGISVPRGILLFGPSGTGKTQIARTLAQESGLHFIGASISDLKANYLGQSGNKVAEIFQRARAASPSIVFIDELDVLTPGRAAHESDAMTREITGQLLQELDGIKASPQPVFVVSASNLPELIDPAIRSRLPQAIEVGLPDLAQRTAIFSMLLLGKPLAFDRIELSHQLAGHTDGKSGRDLRSIVELAEQNAVARAIEAGAPDAVQLEDMDFDLLLASR